MRTAEGELPDVSAAAIHEAGHAVVAMAMGIRIPMVQIQASAGYSACEGVAWPELETDEGRARGRQVLAFIAAGGVAEHLHLPRIPGQGNEALVSWQLERGHENCFNERSDAHQAQEMAMSLAIPRDLDPLDEVKNAEREARQVLDKHEWQLFAIAHALDKCGKLTAEQLSQLSGGQGGAGQ